MSTDKDIYGVFTEFLEKKLQKSDSIFSKETLDELVERYVKNYIGDKNTDEGKKLLKKLKDKETDSKKKEKVELNFIYKVNEQLFNDKENIFGYKDPISEKAKSVFGYLMWLQYLPASKPQSKSKWGTAKCEQIKEITGLDVSYETDGCAGYGMAAMRLDEDLADLVLLFNELVKDGKNKPIKQIKEYIIDWCLDSENVRSNAYNAGQRDCPKQLLPIHNMLLHLCNHDKYEAIAVTGEKEKIVDAFSSVIDDNSDLSLDDKLTIIREKLQMGTKSFYVSPYSNLWRNSIDSPIGKLEYKKAMVLYGPPGTGKTYTALEIAKGLVVKYYLKNEINIDECKHYLDDSKKTEEFLENDEHIFYLQFHINYNYEDFIAGQSIDKNGHINTKKGFIFDIISKAEKKKNAPYIVILDEINRTDISRVFGELFTAIEKRCKDVQLTIPDPSLKNKNLVLNVPENIYFIGTMNEIDFSLERIDFALRRRFIWEYVGYNSDVLKKIISNRLNGLKDNKPKDNQIIDFVDACTKLNEEVKKCPNLDETYHIGHAFFGEIANIYKRIYDEQNRWKKAKDILWQISIKPTLEAYCGTMDRDDKKKYLGERGEAGIFYKAFFGKDTTLEDNAAE